MLDGSVQQSLAGCGPANVGQDKLNHSFLWLRAHVNDIRKMTASSLRERKEGKRQRERVKHCLQQPVCVGECVCVCVFVGNILLLLLTKHAESEK